MGIERIKGLSENPYMEARKYKKELVKAINK